MKKRSWTGLCVLAVVALGTDSAAQTKPDCTKPVAADCLKPNWYTTYCAAQATQISAFCAPTVQPKIASSLSPGVADRVFNQTSGQFATATHHALPVSRIATANRIAGSQITPPSPPPDPNTWAGREEKARLEAVKATVPPQQFHRSGIAAGTTVASCDDYVYKAYWDEEVWADAIFACKGDVACQAMVSLAGQAPTAASQKGTLLATKGTSGPAIPGRYIMSKDNPSQQMFDLDKKDKLKGTIPRNAFFAGTGQYITPSLVNAFATDPAKKASMDRLVAILRQGPLIAYNIGPGGLTSAVQRYNDEWDFHRAMYQKNVAVTQGEFDEYHARNDQMLAAMAAFYAVEKCGCSYAANPTSCRAACSLDIPDALGNVNGLVTQSWHRDPFQSYQVYGSVDPTKAMNMGSVLAAFPQVKQAIADDQQIGQGLAFPGLRGARIEPDGMRDLVGPPPDFNAPSSILDSYFAHHAVVIDKTVPYPRLVCPSRLMSQVQPVRVPGKAESSSTSASSAMSMTLKEINTSGNPASGCLVINTILDEWHRKEAGQPSCFDPANAACDWSPQMFVDRWANTLLGVQSKQKEEKYGFCLGYKNKLFKGGKTYAGPAATDKEIQVFIEDEMKKIKSSGIRVLAKDTFGEDHSTTQRMGSDDFNANYHYDYGWEAKIYNRDATQKPCDLGGRIHGDFGAGGVIFGNGFKVVDASFHADVNDDVNTHQANAKAEYGGHGEFLGNLSQYPLYNLGTHVEALHQSGSILDRKRWDSNDNRTLVLDVPITLGPITVNLSLYLGWDYGATVSVSGEAAVCKKDTPVEFKLKGVAKPYTDVSVDASLDVSVLGFGAGVTCDVTVIDVELPVKAETKVTAKPKGPGFDFDVDLDVSLGTLGGKLSFYVEAMGFHVFDLPVTSWPSVTHRWNVFLSPKASLPLNDLKASFSPETL